MKKSLCVMLLASVMGLTACDTSDSSDSDYTPSSDYTADDSDDGGGGSYNWTYTCDVSGSHEAPIPEGSCESEYKNYAQVFGCNYVEDMDAAACALENCTGQPMGCGGY